MRCDWAVETGGVNSCCCKGLPLLDKAWLGEGIRDWGRDIGLDEGLDPDRDLMMLSGLSTGGTGIPCLRLVRSELVIQHREQDDKQTI